MFVYNQNTQIDNNNNIAIKKPSYYYNFYIFLKYILKNNTL